MNAKFRLSWLFVVPFLMFALGFAFVPLYRIFCNQTGFDGTPRKLNSMSKETTK